MNTEERAQMFDNLHDYSEHVEHLYSGPSILRPPMGPRKCGLILHVILK